MNDALAHFERLYRACPDPWQVASRWYERRKRQLLLASLPQERYAQGFEAGCGNGQTTLSLAQRCDSLHAADFSNHAIEHARELLQQHAVTNVTLQLAHLPWQWPTLQFDLIVVAETAYYLDDAGLAQLLQCCHASLRDGGDLLFCHWRGEFHDRRQDTDAMHEQVSALPWLQSLMTHQETFRLDLWRRRHSA